MDGDVNETFAALHAAEAEMVEAMTPQLRVSFDEIVARLMSGLGESPEAWRGAVLVLMDVLTGLSMAHAECREEDFPPELHFLMLVVVHIVSSPWGMQGLEHARDTHIRGMLRELFREMGIER